jgi:HEAT repeat protein
MAKVDWDSYAGVLRADREGNRARLLSLLDSADKTTRQGAVDAIGRHDWAETAPRLASRVSEETDAEVRRSLARVLAQFADPGTQETFVSLLADDSEDVRRLALRGLSRLRDSQVLELAHDLYWSGGYRMRFEALGALLSLGTPEAEAEVQELLAAESSWRRRRQIKGVIRKHAKRQSSSAEV